MSDKPRRPRVFTDTETTGLSLTRHEIVELAFAIDDDPVTAGVLPHSLRDADQKALEVNGYYRRGLDDASRWEPGLLAQFMRDAAGGLLVGANVAFDAYRIERAAEHASWHYRLGEVESAAWLLLGFDEPPGLRTIRDTLVGLGFKIPEPDHTAGGDVEVVRACLSALEKIAGHLLRDGLPTAEQISG